MFNILLADDEPIVLEGIKFMIEENFSDIQVVGMAHSGREAIELCNHVVPDIVLMDIKMPGINGIEAIETIKARHHEARFVIISAYEQFEFAKQAVELGVSEYILKPINQKKLLHVLSGIMQDIEEERRQKYREMENREKLEKIIPVLEHGFIYSLLLNTDYRDEINRYQELFEIDKESAYIMMIEFGDEDQDKTIQNRIGSGVKGQVFYPKVQSAIKYKCKCIIGPMIINRMTILVYEDRVEKEYEQRIRAIHLAESILESIEGFVDTDVYIGIGSCYRLEKIKNSIEEASYALNRLEGDHIVHVNDTIERTTQDDGYTYVDIKGDETHIVQLMESSQEEELTYELNQFFNRIEKKFGQNLSDIMNIITELMVMVLSSSYKNNLNEVEVGYSTYLGEIRRMENVRELKNWCLNKVFYVARLLKDTRNQHISKVVIEAKAYIDERYNEELGLNDVSKEVAVSPQYFSKIFKEEMGVSFVEYVRQKRMDVAKELLRSKKYSVKEICYQIGYNDPNYFSRLFKKLVGVSPTDFK